MRVYQVVISLFTLPMTFLPLKAQQVRGYPTLQQGTAVALQLDETLDSAHARVGQRVAFEVAADVVVQNQVLIPAGAAALGTVALVSRHGLTGHSWHERAGRIDVNVDAVRLPSGQIVPLMITRDADVAANDDSVAPSMMPPSVSASMVNTRHQDLSIPEGTRLLAAVRRDTVIVQQTASVSD